jgi:rRNA-processing protein FCF1
LQDIKRRVRKPESDASGDDGENDGRGAGLDDPVSAARRLDLQLASLAAGVRGDEIQPPGPGGDPEEVFDALVLPTGIAPDTREAIEWLLMAAPPVPVVVDGYNVTFLLDREAFTAAAARSRLIGELERLLRRARVAHRIVLVFDSSAEGEPQPMVTEGGVEVVFATSSDSADDDIVARVRSLDGRAVVITNDRELRERVGAVGALALWGQAFVDWAAS